MQLRIKYGDEKEMTTFIWRLTWDIDKQFHRKRNKMGTKRRRRLGTMSSVPTILRIIAHQPLIKE